jgi:hypothetical protein
LTKEVREEPTLPFTSDFKNFFGNWRIERGPAMAVCKRDISVVNKPQIVQIPGQTGEKQVQVELCRAEQTDPFW